jgi:hypothetical protein
MSGNGDLVTTLGENALTGWRGAVGRAVARPVSRRTGWSEEQIRTVIGLLIIAYGLYRVLRPAIRAAGSS